MATFSFHLTFRTTEVFINSKNAASKYGDTFQRSTRKHIMGFGLQNCLTYNPPGPSEASPDSLVL